MRWIMRTFREPVPFRIWERNYEDVRYADSRKAPSKVFPPFNPLDYEDREDFECELVPGYGHTIGSNESGTGSLGPSFRVLLPDGTCYPELVRLTCHHVVSESREAIPWTNRDSSRNLFDAPSLSKLQTTIQKCREELETANEPLKELDECRQRYCDDTTGSIEQSFAEILPLFYMEKFERLRTQETALRSEADRLHAKLATLEAFDAEFGHVLFSSGNKIINTVSRRLNKRAMALDYAFVAVRPNRQGQIQVSQAAGALSVYTTDQRYYSCRQQKCGLKGHRQASETSERRDDYRSLTSPRATSLL